MPQLLSVIGPRSGDAPLAYTVTEVGTVDLQTIFAAFDGSGAGGTFRPVVTVRSQNGDILARVFPGDTVAAGDTADVTFAPFLRDGGGCDCAADEGTGTGFQDAILSKNAAGLWKLDETAGTTAADSSGNGNDMAVPANYLPPTWGAEVSPAGTTSAIFVPWAGVDEGSRLAVTLSQALLDNFSAGALVYVPSDISSRVMGQGTWQGANSWSLWIDGNTDKLAASMGASNIFANNVFALDTFYLLGFTRESGTTTLYVNGLAQAATTATGPGAGSTSTWIGADGVGTTGGDSENTRYSWAFITTDPISGAGWADVYASLSGGGPPFVLPAGYVWTADGSGGASWQPPA